MTEPETASKLTVPAKTTSASRVGKRFVESCSFFPFTRFEDFSAVETLQVFGIIVLGDQPDALMLAG